MAVRNISFDIDPVWYKKQQKLAKRSRPPGTRIFKADERLLVGYVDGVLILAFPCLQVSIVTPGAGTGWFSLNPNRFGDLLGTFRAAVRFTVGAEGCSIGSYKQPLSGTLQVNLGASDPAMRELILRLDEIAAEQCFRRLNQEGDAEERRAARLEWHRAGHAVNTSPLLERIRDGSLIVFRLPEARASTPSRRAIVERKEVSADKVSLYCRELRGGQITVDPRWVTHVAT